MLRSTPTYLLTGKIHHTSHANQSRTSLETSRRGIPSRSQPPADSCPLISTCSITNSSLSGLGDKRVVNPVHQYQYALVKLTVSKASVMPLCLRWYRELSRFFPVYALLKAVVWNHKKISGGRSRGGGGICSYRQKRVTVEYNEYVYPAGSSQR